MRVLLEERVFRDFGLEFPQAVKAEAKNYQVQEK